MGSFVLTLILYKKIYKIFFIKVLNKNLVWIVILKCYFKYFFILLKKIEYQNFKKSINFEAISNSFS